LNKIEVAASAAAKLNLPVPEIIAVMDQFIAAVIAQVAAGQEVFIDQIGLYDSYKEPERPPIPAKRLPRFTAASTILDQDMLVGDMTLTGAFAEKDKNIIAECFNVTKKVLASGERVTWQGFGTFEVWQIPARTLIDPDTNEVFESAGGKSARFNSGMDFKKAVAQVNEVVKST